MSISSTHAHGVRVASARLPDVADSVLMDGVLYLNDALTIREGVEHAEKVLRIRIAQVDARVS